MGEVDTLSYAKDVKAVMVDFQDDDRFVSIETLIGTTEDDTLTGHDERAETIEGGDGADTLVGGAGEGDTVSYENSDRRVNIDLSPENDIASGGHAQGDTISGFENVIGSAYNDILAGDDGPNVLRGLAGEDDITGGDGR